MAIPKIQFIALLVLLNAVPIYGIFEWGWKSFDLIFLYWLENLIIGLFVVLRFLVRPYRHAMELMLPLCLAPFFVLHYGMFCYGHGVFVISMFGQEVLGASATDGVFELILPVIEDRHLFWPALALFAYQALDWLRDTLERGLASDGLKDMMVSPYRRIIVLHITILASGFALNAMDEPMAGLLILVVLKMAFDLYHWDKDEKNALVIADKSVDKKIKQKIDAFLDKPKISVNGEEVTFDSYQDLKASKHYVMMQSLLRLLVGNNQLQTVEAYIEQRMKERKTE